MAFGLRRAKALIDRAISFQDFQPMWCGWPTSQTDDGWTDGRTTCNHNTRFALKCIAR